LVNARDCIQFYGIANGLVLLPTITSVLRSVFTENGVQKIVLFVMKVSWSCTLTERNLGCVAKSERICHR
jgi:hypothetical protein